MTQIYHRIRLYRKATRIQTKLPVFISACLLVSSCCSPGVRPEDANLFQAMCGLGTGDFEDQLENDQKQVAASRQALEVEQAKSEALDTDLEASKTKLEDLLKELDQMEQQNRRMEAQISDMQTDTAAAKEEQTRLQTRLESVQDELAALKTRALEEQYAFERYNTEKTRLQQEIEILRMLISAQ